MPAADTGLTQTSNQPRDLVAEFEFDVDEASTTPPPEPTAPSPAAAPPVVATPEPGLVAPAPITHSATLVARARDAHISQQVIDSTPSEQLDAIVYHAEQTERRLLRERPTSTVQPPQNAPEPEPEIGIPAETWDVLDPGLKAFLANQHKTTLELKRELAQSRQQTEQQRAQEIVTRYERFFTSHPEYFGSAPGHTLPPDSEYMLRRNAVASAMQSMTSGTFDQRAKEAMRVLGYKPAAVATQDAIAQRKAEWEKGTTAEPAARAPVTPKKGLALAKKTFLEKMNDVGTAPQVSEEEDGF